MQLEAWCSPAAFPAVMFPLALLPQLHTRGCVQSPSGVRKAKMGLQAPGLHWCLKGQAQDSPLCPTTALPLPRGLTATSLAARSVS